MGNQNMAIVAIKIKTTIEIITKCLRTVTPKTFDDFSSYYFDSVFEYLVVFSDI